MKLFSFLFMINIILSAQSNFEKFFEKKTLRIDYFHAGDKSTDEYFLDGFLEEPFWGGSNKNLIDVFDFGKYKLEVRDSSTNELIYSRCFSTLFSEWQTTEEAKKIKKSFSESVVMPFPKNKAIASIFTRDRKHKLIKKFEVQIDPKNYFISKEKRKPCNNFKVIYNGESSSKVDIVIIPDGYTKDEMEIFKLDCNKFAQYLFNSSPYKENKDKFNIWGVEAPSLESGTDIPAENIWRNTSVNSSFYTFDVERYCMISDYKTVRDFAANAPYDQIYVLVNSKKYGGGSIYNFYSVCVNKNPREEYVFVHEFGHGFAFLADEYYESSTAYQDFYPSDVEPLEPNLTTLIEFDKKWKNQIEKNIPIPTPTEEKYKNSIGVFEGGGYVAKQVYRPMYDCSMKSASVNNFCPVCKETILKMIKFYSE